MKSLSLLLTVVALLLSVLPPALAETVTLNGRARGSFGDPAFVKNQPIIQREYLELRFAHPTELLYFQFSATGRGCDNSRCRYTLAVPMGTEFKSLHQYLSTQGTELIQVVFDHDERTCATYQKWTTPSDVETPITTVEAEKCWPRLKKAVVSVPRQANQVFNF